MTKKEAEPEPQNTATTSQASSERIVPRVIEEEMKTSYLGYAMSVIVGRALPDVRDGLKPVHRRILYAMHDMGIKPTSSYKKCARIVGEVLGKYHPHGDSAVYEALVRMAQDFSMRHPLIDGQGNFGSIDGDNPAAMRYTEARLAKIAEELLRDIEKDTVDMTDNFDGSLKEPVILPAAFPNLLVNGSSGIAVGMATNIPPHNLKEVCHATCKLIDNPDLDPKAIMEILPGPDFPTGGVIAGRAGIAHAYATGRGKIRVKAVLTTETRGEKENIIIKEIPYQVNKAELIEQIARLVNDKIVDGISDLRDESDRTGMRVVIELKKGANADVIKNKLFKNTRLQTTFGINLLVIDKGQPRVCTIKEILEKFIDHRILVVKRRTRYDLNKAEQRAHLLEGLVIALQHIDNVIKIIKAAKDATKASADLISTYRLTKEQANAILEMRLQRLTNLEQQKVREELKQLKELIAKLKDLLSSEEKIKDVIKKELTTIAEKYGDDRRTTITEEEGDLDIEDLVAEEDVVVTITHAGYAKRTPIDIYKIQRRGGVGIRATNTKEEDFVEHLFVANTHAHLLIFTDKGRVHWLKVYNLPEGSRYSKGRALINLVKLSPGERVTSVIPIKEFKQGHYLLMATKKGTVKKTKLEAYSRPRSGGIVAITLKPGDELVNVLLTDGTKQVILATANGRAVKFHEKDVRPAGRSSMGVRGATLAKGESIIGMIIAYDHNDILTVTENGYGKRTPISAYRLTNRGGKGVRNIICNNRNGKATAILSVTAEDEVMLISRQGTIIRTRAKDISRIGRNTQGVRVMNLREGDKLITAAKIVKEDNGELPTTDK
ncbi:DNA gyrase subunit A [Candidatus Woesearchaeota archaeon]|nr:MAG: DNA gyrase subunit A [Candidatus Woesearchaeota archaeon]